MALAVPVLCVAEESASEPAGKQATGSAPDTLISMATLGFGLLAVLALIMGCAWLVRRMNGLTGMNSNAMKVVSVLALGTRERIALVEVGGTQILVGITPSSIRTLHVFDEPVVKPGEGGNTDFAKRLQGLMGRQWASDKTPSDSTGGSS
ncbi:MAG: flagellar biosynthetic protein FliO [Marinobacter sp.]|uniref:flagellar biosynthetic protein FliO n=1 Tax=Marinobacter sp. TaxID=50741 RepID=UPI0034A024C6